MAGEGEDNRRGMGGEWKENNLKKMEGKKYEEHWSIMGEEWEEKIRI
jgi:hypothetical protein